MTSALTFTQLLILPHVRVQHANAISSPLTHGFPSITAFTGLMWALERKCRSEGMDVSFRAVGVVCHDHDEQVAGNRYVKSLRLTRNPVSKNGSTAAIVEEGRIHLELSLIFAVRSERWLAESATQAEDAVRILELLNSMRIAGGSVLPGRGQASSQRTRPRVVDLTGSREEREDVFRRACMRLLPGFALVSREDLLESRWNEMRESEPSATRLDAWLSLVRTNWRYHESGGEPGQPEPKGEWRHDRAGLGWLRPIPVGYGALGPLHEAGTVANARDAETRFRFVESVYSVGQWVSPHRLHDAMDLLWYPETGPDLYRCRNDYRAQAVPAGFDFDLE